MSGNKKSLLCQSMEKRLTITNEGRARETVYGRTEGNAMLHIEQLIR